MGTPDLGRIKIDTDAGEAWLDKWGWMFHVIIIDPYYRFLSRGKENETLRPAGDSGCHSTD